MTSLDDLLDEVSSKESFLIFLEALLVDKIDENEKEKINPSSPYGSGYNGWENNTLEAFLKSVLSFGRDSVAITEAPNWKAFALLLYAGKFYE